MLSRISNKQVYFETRPRASLLTADEENTQRGVEERMQVIRYGEKRFAELTK